MYVISEDTLNGVINYLKRRPWDEVEGGIQKLKNLTKFKDCQEVRDYKKQIEKLENKAFDLEAQASSIDAQIEELEEEIDKTITQCSHDHCTNS